MTPPDPAAPAREWAAFHLQCGITPIPVPFKSKKPVMDGWPTLRLTPETVPDYFNGAPQNVGLLLGAASDGFTDVDLDCLEAVMLAPQFLPPTNYLFGRASTGPSHRGYRVTPALDTIQFEGVDKGPDGARAMLLEVRGTGSQTIGPGSVHPDGERIMFVGSDFAPPLVDGAQLVHGARLLAIAVILGRHWPTEGARHRAALGAAGLLLGAHVPVDDVVLVVTTAARLAGDTEAKARRADVLSTHDKLAAGAPVLGGPELAKVLTGDAAAVVKRIRGWLGMHQTAEPRWFPPADRPQIDTGNLGLAEMSAAAWRAIEAANVPPRLYAYGSGLAWLVTDLAGRPQIQVMGRDQVRHHLAQVVAFVRWTAAPGRAPVMKPDFPPLALVADLLAVPRGALPPLTRLVRGPVFTAEGRVLTEPGYDPASGLYYAPPAGLMIPAVPEAPTAEAVAAARRLLVEELLGDFPFVSAADRAHALALLLTLLLREYLPGDTPLFMVSKSTPRTGAGLLVKVLSLIHDGVAAPPTTISPAEEEMRKRLTAFLLAGPSLVLLDNLQGRLDSAALASILTCGGLWTDRFLGQSREVTVPVRAVFVATGNNPALSNEIAGRAVLIRLDAKMEDPGLRSGFRHPQLEAWALEHRGELLAAALTLGQAWLARGRPRAIHLTFGGFQEWAEVLGGVLATAGISGLLDNRSQLLEEADEEGLHLRDFLAAWWSQYQRTPVSTKELLPLAIVRPLDITAKSEQGTLVRLGRLIGRHAGRWYRAGPGLVAIQRVGNKDGGVAWFLADSPAEGGD